MLAPGAMRKRFQHFMNRKASLEMQYAPVELPSQRYGRAAVYQSETFASAKPWFPRRANSPEARMLTQSLGPGVSLGLSRRWVRLDMGWA